MRYKLLIEYDGTNYSGWQRQENSPSIQGNIEDAIEKFCGMKVTVNGAGRTDSGVHASGQVAHFDLDDERDENTTIGNFIFLRPGSKCSDIFIASINLGYWLILSSVSYWAFSPNFDKAVSIPLLSNKVYKPIELIFTGSQPYSLIR